MDKADKHTLKSVMWTVLGLVAGLAITLALFWDKL